MNYPCFGSNGGAFEVGDIMLADKGFCSFYDVRQFQQRGVDCVLPLARRKPVEAASAVAILGQDDLLIEWPKPKLNKASSYSKEEWEALPDSLTLRQIKVTVNTPGFRVNSYYLITTLTDESTYSAADLAALYHQRWDVELFFRDLKTTMGMDILRCHTPAMVRKEILMHFIVYNTIRLLMLEAAKDLKVPPRKISFKASMQALRQWEPRLNKTHVTDQQRRMLINQLRQAIASAILADRPGRREPRCLKRRPKSFGLLTKPRHKMLEIPHRNKYRAKVA